MDVFELLTMSEDSAPDELEEAYFRLLKCYEFAAAGSEYEALQDILMDKYNKVRELRDRIQLHGPDRYKSQVGISDRYKELLAILEEGVSNSNMPEFMDRLRDAAAEEPGSVYYSVLAYILFERIDRV